MINVKELIIRAFVTPDENPENKSKGMAQSTGSGNCGGTEKTEAKELMEEFQNMLQEGQTAGFKSSKR